jgi:hypothetical protein
VKASYSCAEVGALVGSAKVTVCKGTPPNGAAIYTRSAGSKSFTVNAVDSRGHTASRTVVYTVVPVSPTSLWFGTRRIGTTSYPRAVVVTNTQTTIVGIASTIGGDFHEVSRCGPVLAPGAHCAILVSFAPTAVGTRTATLVVTEAGTPYSVSLGGAGVKSDDIKHRTRR